MCMVAYIRKKFPSPGDTYRGFRYEQGLFPDNMITYDKFMSLPDLQRRNIWSTQGHVSHESQDMFTESDPLMSSPTQGWNNLKIFR